jgi:hypothetical protein
MESKYIQCYFIDFPINTTLQITVYSFFHHIHYDMFRPVISTIIGWCYYYIKGKKVLFFILISKKEATASVPPLHITVVLSDNGCRNMSQWMWKINEYTNKWIYNHLCRCINRRIDKLTLIEQIHSDGVTQKINTSTVSSS